MELPTDSLSIGRGSVTPDVIVGKFSIFETIVYALIDPGSTHSYVCTSIPSLGSLPKSETKYKP